MRSDDHHQPAGELLLALGVAALALILAAPAASAAPRTKLISQSSAGDQVAEESETPDVSATGRLIVFNTKGALLPADPNADDDVYVRSVSARKTKLASRGQGGVWGDAWSVRGAISDSGRYVVFSSNASNLIKGLTILGPQIYRRDIKTGRTLLASRGAAGPADGGCRQPQISATGRHVVFTCSATNLTGKDTHGKDQVYLRDMKLKRTYLISQAKGQAGDRYSGGPVVSADGRYVAFASVATNLTSKDTRGVEQVYLRDRKLKRTLLISRNRSGKAADGYSSDPAVSADGRVVVFASTAGNLIGAKDTNGEMDIYRREWKRNRTSRVSLDWKGRQLKGGVSHDPDISADGHVIVFTSLADDVVKGLGGPLAHVYRRDLRSGRVKLVDRNNRGTVANDDSGNPELSANGRYVVFDSGATNLAPGGDDNDMYDVFRRGPF
jgi:Tol biopolymer transport system component